VDDSFLILFNPTHEHAAVTLPGEAYGSSWSVVLDTGGGSVEGARAAGSQQEVGARSLAVLRNA
jgi:glycogen operon protein